MMDADQLYPKGFHPVLEEYLPDGRSYARPLSRANAHVKYYYVDFGISVCFAADQHPKLAVGEYGRDQEVPELSAEVPYDPFKVDIFIVGNVFRRELYNVRVLFTTWLKHRPIPNRISLILTFYCLSLMQ